jgi:Ca2+-binding RTX toxin-like protein
VSSTRSAVLVLVLFAIPGSASAHITGSYSGDGVETARVLQIESDSAADTIATACAGDSVTVNGNVITIQGHRIACGGSLGPQSIDVHGGGGNDTIDLTQVSREAGFTEILKFAAGGAPTDTVAATGGLGHDTLVGGPLGEDFNNVGFNNEPGGDTVRGNGGDDRVRGTTIGDRLFGGAGNDVLDGLTGADYMRGGPGRDFLDATVYDKKGDKMYGDAGRDELIAGAGNDLLDGGSGNDFMQGGRGRDRMLGRAGNDALQGQGGADTIFGNAGKDYIRGGGGRDKIHPGAGKDNAKQ